MKRSVLNLTSIVCRGAGKITKERLAEYEKVGAKFNKYSV